ncbi:MAG: glutathione synthase [Gammaproteobacteria bacterium]|nr:glutathione synthase [Gammaproteobacteria bacterium]
MKLAIVMDPLDTINIKKDSTYAMIKEASRRNWQIFCCTVHDLYVDNSIPKAIFTEIIYTNNSNTNNKWYEARQSINLDLREVDIILLRKDPPVNLDYIYATYILDLAKSYGTLVANDPTAVRSYNEKLSTLNFPELIPPNLITTNKAKLLEFINNYKTIIIKPLDGMGGRSIFKIEHGDANTSVILDTMTDNGIEMVFAQKYIPEITEGDKRIILINGEPISYGLARIPATGEIRGNLAAGAKGVGFELTKQDKLICEKISPWLKSNKLFFVGIDVIGNYLTEINVTCPTCVQEIGAIFGCDISSEYLNFLESYLHL